MFRPELQRPFRHATARARPHLPVQRRARLRRPEVVHLPARHDPGLSGNADATGLRLRESPGLEVVRLRHFVLRLMRTNLSRMIVLLPASACATGQSASAPGSGLPMHVEEELET